MGMWGMFPLVILIPALGIFLVLVFGGRILRDLFQGLGGRPGPRGWLSGDSWQNREGRSRFGAPRPYTLEARIFRLAFKRKGRVTISDIVLETGLGLKEAEEAANALVDGMRVRMEVDERGLVVYEFPEIIARFEGT